MHLPDRNGLPRWARALTSPWLISPILVFVLLIGAFLGYGAYTRSKPTHYSRGGDVFAAGIAPNPSASPSTLAKPSPRASAATTTAAKHARGAAAAAANSSSGGQQAAPQSAPSRLPGAPDVVLPATGTYRLAVSGSENVKFGFVPGCHNTFPSTSSLVVSKATGESPTSYNFDLRLFPSQPNRHDERHIYRYTSSGVYLDFEEATVTCSGVKQSSTVNYSPSQLRARLPLQVGASWHTKGGDSARTEDATANVAGTTYLTASGRRYLVYVINTTVKMTGSETGSRSQTWWYAPSLGVPLKWREHLSGSRSGATYTEDLTCTVTELP
jgi:hypothetical protein